MLIPAKAGAVAALALACGISVSAQLAFDVASIKESHSLSEGGSFRFLPDGVRGENIPALTLFTVGHHLNWFQIVGVPQWARDTRFDILARSTRTPTRDDTTEMVRTLLADRFQLQFHREQRPMDGYALVRMRPDRLGPDIKASALDCGRKFEPACRVGAITYEAARTAKMVGSPIWSLQQMLIGELSAPVEDETQLAGTFDFELRWSSDVAPSGDTRSVFTALQEQLGLRLERRKVSAEVFVIDRLEHPTPD